jgi:hypothetical protein
MKMIKREEYGNYMRGIRASSVVLRDRLKKCSDTVDDM